jgi:hypothetical protein
LSEFGDNWFNQFSAAAPTRSLRNLVRTAGAAHVSAVANGVSRNFLPNTVATQLPIAIWNVDRGEEGIEVLDVRLIRIKAAAQQTADAKAGSDSRKRSTSAAVAIRRGTLGQVSQTPKVHLLIHRALASAAHK